MARNNPYQQQYRQNQIMTATPQQLVLMLYDRALRDLGQAAQAIEENDPMAANKSLQHLEDILNELLMGLDLDQGGEIALNLGRMYDYYIVRAREANIEKNATIVEELKTQIGELRQTWAEAMLKARQESSEGTPDHV